MPADILERVFYGVWLPKRGWLKVNNDAGFADCYSDMNRDVVEDTARRFHGEVRYVDGSLFRLEAQILEVEREDDERKLKAALAVLHRDEKRGNLWRTFKTLKDNLLHR